jgi:putative resolvase
MKVSIDQAAKEPGVSRETLRRWEAAGKLQVGRTPKGHRRYDLSKLYGITPHPALAGRPTLAYACVSSHDQKEDLNRQVAWLETYCAANGWTDEVIQDWGSGMNNPKKGLQQLIQRIGSGQVGR